MDSTETPTFKRYVSGSQRPLPDTNMTNSKTSGIVIHTVSGTPSSQKASVAIHSKGTAERTNKITHDADHIIEGQLHEAMLEDSNNLLDDTFNQLPFDSKALLGHLEAEGLYNANDGWRDWPEVFSETNVAAFLESLADSVDSYLHLLNIDIGARRHYSAIYHAKPIPDPNCARKPDGIVTEQLPIDEDESFTWWKVLITIELKSNIKDVREAQLALAQGARILRFTHPNRTHVIGISILQTHFIITKFDHSGAVSSRTFDLQKDPAEFLQAIIGVLYVPLHALGMDPTVQLDDHNRGRIKAGKKWYDVEDVLYVEGVIRGRGTVIYRVQDGKDILIVKDAWIDKSRDLTEEEVLNELVDVPHTPVIYSSEIVEAPGVPSSTAFARREFLDITEKDGKTTYKWKSKAHEGIEIREHRRIVMGPCGKRLEHFNSLLDLVKIFRDVTLGE